MLGPICRLAQSADWDPICRLCPSLQTVQEERPNLQIGAQSADWVPICRLKIRCCKVPICRIRQKVPICRLKVRK